MFPFDDNIPSIPSIPTLYTSDSGRRPANGPLPGYRRRNMLLRMIRSATRLSVNYWTLISVEYPAYD